MKEIMIETSARHAHVTAEAFAILFGDSAQLEIKKMLSQPGQFASGQKIDVVGPKNTIKGVSILGPFRNANQVEVSLTDARSLGIAAPIRESGDIAHSGACKLVGPHGEIEIEEGVIVAKRHIHLTEADAKECEVKNGEIVSVQVLNETGRGIVFGDVVIRVSDRFALAMHVDTDEANAAALSGTVFGKILR